MKIQTKLTALTLIIQTSLFLGLATTSMQSYANANATNTVKSSAAQQEAEHGHDHDTEKAHDDSDVELELEHEHEQEENHKEEGKDDGHGHGGGGHEEEESEGVKLSSSQLTLADIEVTPLTLQAMSFDIYAPGEIKANDYTSYLVSPRVDSVVIKRHVALGDHVNKGQALVTLFSEAVAEAQASYKVANAEWQRVQKLGRKAVGDKRYIEAQSAYYADLGRLSAFGLSSKAIATLNKSSLQSLETLGQYTLNAITSGAVLSDSFRQGQRVESGDTLIELADEQTLWAEARLAPTIQLNIPVGSVAKVQVGDTSYRAIVTQKAHTIDPITRTRTVRLQVENSDHKLHPGLFADIYFAFDTQQQVLAVPEEALMRGGDGDWMVFVENNGEFTGVEIELGQSLSGNMREIKGIAAGTNVVVKGAFYVAAEIAKGGFDAHNH